MPAHHRTQPTGARSREWFGAEGKNGFIHRSWMRNQGFAPDVMDGRPVIGIGTTWSEFTPCNAHLRRVAESVKRGVWEMGGFTRVRCHVTWRSNDATNNNVVPKSSRSRNRRAHSRQSYGWRSSPLWLR